MADYPMPLANYRITAVRRPDSLSSVEHITHVLVPELGLQPIAVSDVIKMIGEGFSFYVRIGLFRASVVKIARHGVLSPPFIQTVSDSAKADNLLSLPAC